jgi:hypothetical protein
MQHGFISEVLITLKSTKQRTEQNDSINNYFYRECFLQPIPTAARSKGLDCLRLLDGTACLNLAGAGVVCLL